MGTEASSSNPDAAATSLGGVRQATLAHCSFSSPWSVNGDAAAKLTLIIEFSDKC